MVIKNNSACNQATLLIQYTTHCTISATNITTSNIAVSLPDVTLQFRQTTFG